MNQETINLILGLLASSPLVLYIVQQFYQRRKNKIDYGDDLLEAMNTTAASLKQARADLAQLQQEIKVSETEHEQEMASIESVWKEKQERMKKRIRELESTITKYDISFTLTTHPTVAVTDLKVIGKEDVLASQRIKAITKEKESE